MYQEAQSNNDHKAQGDNDHTPNSYPKVISEHVFTRWDYLVFALLTVVGIAAIVDLLWYWFSFGDWRHYPVTFWSMTLILIVILSNNQGRWFLLPNMRRPVPMAPAPGWKVAVATTFVPGKESLEMLEETVTALVTLSYPHDTWVLDEGDDAQVKALCRKLGAKHFSRKHLSGYQTTSGPFQSSSKHGNYNAWFHAIAFEGYDIITAFDPDHVPDPSFLSHVLGYFADPTVGYVQVAQAYYNQQASFIARGAAEETYAYYSSTQMTGYGLRYGQLQGIRHYHWMPQVIGCHNTHRVSALKDVGGFAAHDADDLLITQMYCAQGWQGVYVPQILARGLTPVNWSGYLDQQRRWCRSILDIKFRTASSSTWDSFFKTSLISYLHGIFYIHRSLAIFASLMLTALMLATGGIPKVISYPLLQPLMIVSIASLLCEFYRQFFYLDWHNEWGLHWRSAILQYAKWPYHLLAVFDVVLCRRIPYILTLKVRETSRRYMLFYPNIAIILFLCSSMLIGIVCGHRIHPLLYLWTGLIVIGSVALMLTELLNFPDPYDKTLSLLAENRRYDTTASALQKFQ